MEQFKCKICSRTFTSIGALSLHVVKAHKIDKKTYYVQYMGNKLGICSCGKETSFRGLVVGFDTHCSIKCSANSKETREKYADTCVDRYGVVSKSKTDEYKEATKEANLLKYGVEFRCQTEEFKEKSKQTCLIKYGTERASQNVDVIEKGKKTCIERFGVESAVLLPTTIENRNRILKEKFGESGSPFAHKENQIKSVNTRMERYSIPYARSKGSPFTQQAIEKANITILKQTIDTYTPMLSIHDCKLLSYENGYFTYICNKCNNEITETYAITRGRLLTNVEPCTICNPRMKYTSNMEKTLCDFIKTFNHTVIENTNTIISPKEIDIYLPDLNIAFEFNGIYHHSESFKPINYHKLKTEACLNKNINLIHVFEDDWVNHRDIIESNINMILGNNCTIIDGNSCIIKSLDEQDCNIFLNNNHLKGICNATHMYGLIYNGDIIMIMTFNINQQPTELIRYCVKLNTIVTNGAYILFNHIINKYPHIYKIITYTDRSWPIDTIFNDLGFTVSSYTNPDYMYINRSSRYDKKLYTKEILISEGYDKDKTEHDIMLGRNIYRIYDCGCIKYTWNRTK